MLGWNQRQFISIKIKERSNNVFTVFTMHETLIQFAMNAIILHLRQRPQSADTLEGIHSWWIPWPDMQESILVTAEALNRLKEAQVVETFVIAEREVWRLSRQPD